MNWVLKRFLSIFNHLQPQPHLISPLVLPGMHRKSLEAAHHLKDDCNTATSSDHEESASMQTEASDASATSSQQTSTQPQTNATQPTNDKEQKSGGFEEDPEAFRNNSIACLRAKAQEHSAKLLNHNLLMHQVVGQQGGGCDANANNLMHQGTSMPSDTAAIFWQKDLVKLE